MRRRPTRSSTSATTTASTKSSPAGRAISSAPTPATKALLEPSRRPAAPRARPPTIDKFVSSERARLHSQVFATLPKGSRTIEILDGRVALFVFDKAVLDEEDIAAASVLVFGKSDDATRPPRRRAHLRLARPDRLARTAASRLLDDGGGGIRVEVLRAGTTKVLLSDQIGQSSGGRMRVQRDP